MNDYTYEQAYNELSAIVTELEGEDVQLDMLSEKIKRAATLIEFCQTKLRSTEEEFQKAMEKISRKS